MPDDERRLSEGPSATTRYLAIIVVAGLVVGGGWKLATSGGGGHGGAWLHDHAEGVAAARAGGRPMLVLYTADWCPPCRQLKRDVLGDPAIAARLERDFVLVKVDLTDRASDAVALAQEAAVEGIPTMIRYDRSLLEVDRFVGGAPRDAFLAWLSADTHGSP